MDGGGSGRRRITVSKNGIAESSVETQVSFRYTITCRFNCKIIVRVISLPDHKNLTA